jgi:prepilin-type N-terminal cleavage/methylation domain-containing protein
MLKAKIKFARQARKKASAFACAGFTMVEIAISLAVIGIALVSIIGVLPIGMHTQRDNREETLINQDATILLEAIRGGARGLNDLTNYVFAITNYWTEYTGTNMSINRRGTNGYTFTASFPAVPPLPLTNGSRIIGLLSTPEYTALNGWPIPHLLNGGVSNHIVAYVRSLSGPAVEKPPQDNDILRTDSFGYRLLCVNAPVAGHIPPPWQDLAYNAGDLVSYPPNGQTTYWQATAATAAFDEPSLSSLWKRVSYPEQLAANLREVRLTFFWPLLPNNSLPGDAKHQTFRTLVAGQLMQPFGYTNQYYYQPQSFAFVL